MSFGGCWTRIPFHPSVIGAVAGHDVVPPERRAPDRLENGRTRPRPTARTRSCHPAPFRVCSPGELPVVSLPGPRTTLPFSCLLSFREPPSRPLVPRVGRDVSGTCPRSAVARDGLPDRSARTRRSACAQREDISTSPLRRRVRREEPERIEVLTDKPAR
jgi:hypothetical protein